MTEQEQKMHLRLLILITDSKKAPKAEQILSQLGLFMHYCILGKGTAGRDMIDYLGLDGTEKVIFICITTDTVAKETACSLNLSIQLYKPGHGIVFTIPIDGSTGKIFRMAAEGIIQKPHTALTHHDCLNQNSEGEKNMLESNLNELILVIANQGFSEEIMHTAREKGATGGTIITARQPNLQKAIPFWGVSVQEKKR